MHCCVGTFVGSTKNFLPLFRWVNKGTRRTKELFKIIVGLISLNLQSYNYEELTNSGMCTLLLHHFLCHWWSNVYGIKFTITIYIVYVISQVTWAESLSKTSLPCKGKVCIHITLPILHLWNYTGYVVDVCYFQSRIWSYFHLQQYDACQIPAYITS